MRFASKRMYWTDQRKRCRDGSTKPDRNAVQNGQAHLKIVHYVQSVEDESLSAKRRSVLDFGLINSSDKVRKVKLCIIRTGCHMTTLLVKSRTASAQGFKIVGFNTQALALRKVERERTYAVSLHKL